MLVILMEWECVSELWPSTGILAYCSSPGWYMNVENHGRMISTGKTPDSPTRAMAVLPVESSSSKAWYIFEGNDQFFLALLSFRRKTCCRFVSPSVGSDPVKLRSISMHDKYYTTEDDFWYIAPCCMVDIDRRFRRTYYFNHWDSHLSPWWWINYFTRKSHRQR
jgi:hypothetical protein